MRKLYILTVLAALAAGGAGVSAETVSPDEARRVADEFLGVRTQPSRIVRHGAKGAAVTERQPYYVFNSQTDNGGFVIVSGNTGARKILGYSRTGRFDTDSIPPQVADLLDQYSRCLSTLPADAPAHSSWKEQEASPDEVVLTTATWHQGYPFNEMCPDYPFGGHYNSGCVPTATGIIMKYHNWPSKGEGQVSYEWNGQTLSCDLSKSNYNWDLIYDNYVEDNYPSDIEYEMAHLMSDICTAVKANYTFYGTSATSENACLALANNFSYYPAIQVLTLGYCPVTQLVETIRCEIDSHRPVLCGSGKTPGSSISHAYVCDGYNSDGYIHFNFGWGGSSNGFYSIDPVTGFAGLDFDICYGIQPTNLNEPETNLLPTVGITKFTVKNEKIYCVFTVRNNSIESSVSSLQIGYVCENTDNSSRTFYTKKKYTENYNDLAHYMTAFECKFEENLPDGHYIIYPAFQIDDNPWEKCLTSDYKQDKIEVTISDGEVALKNLPPDNNPIAPGRVKVGDIYYILDQNNYTAEVTAANDLGIIPSYEGDMEIPSEIQLDGKTYTVTSIGRRSFDECVFGDVRLPESLQVIKSGAFNAVGGIKSINLPELVNLKTIEGWNFCGYGKESVFPPKLPPNIESLGTYAFSWMDWPILEIPSSLRYIANEGLTLGNAIDAIIFKHRDLSDLKLEIHSLLEYPDNGGEPSKHLTVFVPAGMKEDYLAYHDIKKCEVVEYTGEVVLPSDVSFMVEGKTYSDGETVGMAANGTIRLQPVFYPGNTTMTNVKWEYPEEYFSMDADGNLKYLGNADPVSAKRGVDGIGEVLTRSSATTALGPIVARTLDGSRLTRQFYVDIYPDTESVSLDAADKTLANGEAFRLTATVMPEDAAGTIHWTSSNSTVATVSQDGEVIAMAPGTAVITATAADGSGVSASCEVTVSGGTVGVPMTGVDLNEPIEVYDAAGTCVYKGNADNLPALGKGFYIMTVRDRRIKVMR